MNARIYLLSGIAVLACAGASSGETVNFSASKYNGFADSGGSALASGDLVELGYFNLTDAQIQANATNVAFLDNNFAEFGVAHVGDNLSGTPGYFDASAMASTAAANRSDGQNLVGKQMYFWIFNAATQGQATQEGIYYLSGSANSNWTFTDDSTMPNVFNVDISDLTGQANSLVTGAKVLVGTFGPGQLSPGGGIVNATAFQTTAIPEPCSLLMAIAGAVPLFFRLRRK